MTTQTVSADQIKSAVAAKLSSGEINSDQARLILKTWGEKNGLIQPQKPMNLVQGTVKSVTEGVKDLPETVAGLGETALTIGTSALAEPLAGFAGMGMTALGSAFDVEDPVALGVKAVEGTRDAITYNPKTGYGQDYMGLVGKALTPLGKLLQKTSEFTGEIGYKSPVAPELTGAAAYAIPEALLEIVGVKGTKAAKTKAIKAQVDAGNIDDIMTPQVQALLEKQGFTTDEIARIVEIDPAQLERIKRFDELGIQATKGDVTQLTADRKPEQQLLETAEGEAANEMRQLRVQQSAQIENNLNALVDRSIDNEVLGASIKDALMDRKSMTEEAYRRSYDALAEAQKGVDVPVLIDDYRNIDNLPDAGELRDIQANKPALYDTLEGVLTEFGINPDEKKIAALIEKGVNPQHVNLANFDRLRKRLGNIERMDDTGMMGRIINPIRKELDRQVELATKTLENSSDANIANLAKDARLNYRASKLEFDGKTLADDLTKKAPRSEQPAIYSSEVYNKIVAPNVPIEKLDDMIQSLKAQGKQGDVAIAQLQSNTIMDLLDSSLKGTTNTIDGSKVFSPAAFQRRLEVLNKNGKLKLIFQDNPRAYKTLMDNAQAMQDLTPGKLDIVKGSGSTMLDIVNTLGLAKVTAMIPFGGAAMEGLNGLSTRSKNRKVFNKALERRPEVKEAVGIMASNYPSLAAALGIGYVAQQTEDE
jgi:hypothetical protein